VNNWGYARWAPDANREIYSYPGLPLRKRNHLISQIFNLCMYILVINKHI
jgi:hypothetical protein